MPTPSSSKSAFRLDTLAPDDTSPPNIDVVMTPAFAAHLARLIRRHAPSSLEGGAGLRALGLQIEHSLPHTPRTAPNAQQQPHPL